jgi:hypothetical protein
MESGNFYEKRINSSVVVDPSVVTHYRVSCESCGKRLNNLRHFVMNERKSGKEFVDIKEYGGFRIRPCCKAALMSDYVTPNIPFNPEVEAGMLSPQEARQQESDEKYKMPYEVWRGHMKITEYRTIINEDGTYSAVDPVTGEIVDSYTPDESRQRVVGWVEIPHPDLASRIFQKKPKTKMLLPVLSSVTYWSGRDVRPFPYNENRPKRRDPLFEELSKFEEEG